MISFLGKASLPRGKFLEICEIADYEKKKSIDEEIFFRVCRIVSIMQGNNELTKDIVSNFLLL